MRQIFDYSKEVKIKNQNTQYIILAILSFVIVPIINVGVTFAGGERPISTSLSRIAWPQGLFPLALFAGGLNFGLFLYGLYHILESGRYAKWFKKLLYAIAGFGVLIITVGLSIPAYYEPDDAHLTALRTAHTSLCAPGFFMPFFVLIFVAVTSYKRNLMQGLTETGILAFMLIICVYAITQANDKDSYCVTSAVSQILMLSSYSAAATIFTFLNNMIKDKNAPEIEA